MKPAPLKRAKKVNGVKIFEDILKQNEVDDSMSWHFPYENREQAIKEFAEFLSIGKNHFVESFSIDVRIEREMNVNEEKYKCQNKQFRART
ncbi:MAG: hypothetical protein ABR955_12525 [Verrucomicrobiota bacterium]|jgi:hypothetical protein